MTTTGMMTIGTFSRSSSLSIKALRAYHEAGILVPARVDPASGYRSYTVDQLADAAVIVRLRALDVPLEQVGRVLRARDPELTRTILAEHHIRMSERLVATERIVAELQAGTAPPTHTPVHVRDEPATHTLRMRRTVTDDELWPWVTSAHERLVDHLAASRVAPSGPASALYLPEIAEDGIEPVEAYVPVAAPVAVVGAHPDIALGEVPAARVAVLVHAGGYDTIGDTYRLLGAWVGRHAEPSGERIRERYLAGPPDVDDVERFRTEIAWPISAIEDPA
jgi:DNA-binding transcriptional MerR regulator